VYYFFANQKGLNLDAGPNLFMGQNIHDFLALALWDTYLENI
jgi:hypothetical protein